MHTIRAVGAVTKALCALEPGAVLGARGPFGNRWPLDAARGRDLVLVGGGVGLPRSVRSSTTRSRTASTSASCVLLYGGRTPGDLLFPHELSAGAAVTTCMST